jgi:hypothetical protein
MKCFFGIKEKPFSIGLNYVDAQKKSDAYEIQIGNNKFEGKKNADGLVGFQLKDLNLQFEIVLEAEHYARLKVRGNA